MSSRGVSPEFSMRVFTSETMTQGCAQNNEHTAVFPQTHGVIRRGMNITCVAPCKDLFIGAAILL